MVLITNKYHLLVQYGTLYDILKRILILKDKRSLLKYFLKMNAWMIFSFVTLLYLISILSFFLHSIFELFDIILLIEITFITGWFYSLAKLYYCRIPRFKGLNFMLLKIGLLAVNLYTLSMAILRLIDYSMASKMIFYLLPVHYYSMYSMFYCIYLG
jgi:signal transduction histidine kinase